MKNIYALIFILLIMGLARAEAGTGADRIHKGLRLLADTGVTPPPPPPPPPAPACDVSIRSWRDHVNRHLYTFTANAHLPGGTAETILWAVDSSYAGTGDSLTATLANGIHRVWVALFTGTGCRAEDGRFFIVDDLMPDSAIFYGPNIPYCAVGFTTTPIPPAARQFAFSVADGSGFRNALWRVYSAGDAGYLQAGSGPHFTYTFPAPGFYFVSVLASTDSPLGCTAFASQVINVDTSAVSAETNFIRSYPNPVVSMTSVDVTLVQPARVYIRVYNSMGNAVLDTSVPGLAGMNHLQLPIGSLQSGVYYIQVQYGNEIKRSKIQKL